MTFTREAAAAALSQWPMLAACGSNGLKHLVHGHTFHSSQKAFPVFDAISSSIVRLQRFIDRLKIGILPGGNILVPYLNLDRVAEVRARAVAFEIL